MTRRPGGEDVGRGWWREAGQALSEYVVITGLLVLIGMSIAATLHAGLKTFVRNAVTAVRTVAP